MYAVMMTVCLLLSISPALTAVLYDLSRQIPQLKKDIQDGLLKMLSLVLMHKPQTHGQHRFQKLFNVLLDTWPHGSCQHTNAGEDCSINLHRLLPPGKRSHRS